MLTRHFMKQTYDSLCYSSQQDPFGAWNPFRSGHFEPSGPKLSPVGQRWARAYAVATSSSLSKLQVLRASLSGAVIDWPGSNYGSDHQVSLLWWSNPIKLQRLYLGAELERGSEFWAWKRPRMRGQ